MESAADDESEQASAAAAPAALGRPVQRVLALAALVAVSAVIAVAFVPDPTIAARQSNWSLVVMIVVAFGLAEYFAFHVEYRREAHSFSISDVPTALALVFLSPVAAIAIRLVVAATVVQLRWRPPLFKQLFNASLFAFEVSAAVLIVRTIAPLETAGDAHLLLAIGAGLVVASSIGSVFVSLAIACFEGNARRHVMDELGTSAFVSPIIALIAVSAVAPVMIHIALVGIAIVPVAAGWFVLERHGRLSQHHRDLQALHGFAGLVGRSLDLEEVATAAVSEVARLLRAERAVIQIVDEAGRVVMASGVNTPTPHDSTLPAFMAGTALVPDGADCHLAPDGRVEAAGQARPNAMAVPIRDEDGVLGMIVVADRSGALADFGPAERSRAATLAEQLAANVRKALLLEDIEHTALHDSLTGDPNRLAFEQAVAGIGDGVDGCVAVLMLDLNRFKEVNDTLGHRVGDEVLQQFSQRVKRQLHPGDLFARFGGDEFAILVTRPDIESVYDLADTIRSRSFAPFRLGDLDVVVTTSVGIAEWAAAGHDVAEVLRRADIAMYAAKREHTNVEVYREEIDRRTPERLSLLVGLRQALLHDGLEVHYQPKVDLVTSTVIGAEALVRWKHPTRGWISPVDFVQLAEESGLITQLTDRVLTAAITTAGTWRAAGFDLKVAVNLSTHDLLDERLPHRIGDLLERHGAAPERLTLEITESALLADTPRTMGTVDRLHELGVRLSLDDFGTGYSSLGYLRRLPVSELKVDQSFVKNLLLDEQDEVIVRSTIDLGHNLGLQVVAEGIENEPVLDRLRELGCDVGQGYCISRPLAPGLFDAWLRTTRYTVASAAIAH